MRSLSREQSNSLRFRCSRNVSGSNKPCTPSRVSENEKKKSRQCRHTRKRSLRNRIARTSQTRFVNAMRCKKSLVSKMDVLFFIEKRNFLFVNEYNYKVQLLMHFRNKPSISMHSSLTVRQRYNNGKVYRF